MDFCQLRNILVHQSKQLFFHFLIIFGGHLKFKTAFYPFFDYSIDRRFCCANQTLSISPLLSEFCPRKNRSIFAAYPLVYPQEIFAEHFSKKWGCTFSLSCSLVNPVRDQVTKFRQIEDSSLRLKSSSAFFIVPFSILCSMWLHACA